MNRAAVVLGGYLKCTTKLIAIASTVVRSTKISGRRLIFVIAVTLILSCLSVAAWLLGLIDANRAGRKITLDISIPCLSHGVADFYITTTILSKHNNPIQRLLHRVAPDRVTIDFTVFDGTTFTSDDFVRTCKQPIILKINSPAIFNDISQHRVPDNNTPQAAANTYSLYPNDQSHIFSQANGRMRIQFELESALMSERGLAEAVLVNAVSIRGNRASMPKISLHATVAIPHRFDQITAPGAIVQDTTTPDQTALREVVITRESTQLPDVKAVDPVVPPGCSLTITCVDTRMRRLEGLLLFVAAAIFGTAVSALLELMLASLKPAQSLEG